MVNPCEYAFDDWTRKNKAITKHRNILLNIIMGYKMNEVYFLSICSGHPSMFGHGHINNLNLLQVGLTGKMKKSREGAREI